MTIPLLRPASVITTNEVFRVASLFFYIILLVHVAMAAATQRLMFSDNSAAAVSLLLLLFLVSLGRFIWPKAVAYSQGHVLVEMGLVMLLVSMLALQRTVPSVSLSWLIAVAGVFLLPLEAIGALIAILCTVVLSFMLGTWLGTRLSDWLPQLYALVFIGLLARLLSRALKLNLSALEQAHLNERRFDAIARATRHVFMIVDARFQVKYVNPAIHEVTGFTEEEVRHLTLKSANHPDDEEEHKKKLRYLRDVPHSSIFSRHRTRHKKGHWVWVEACGYNMLHDSAIKGLVFSIEDITARKEAERRLAEEHALLRAVLDHNPSMIYAKDTEGRYTISNLSYQRRFGYSSEDALRGKTVQEVFLLQENRSPQPPACELVGQMHRQDLEVMQTGEALIDLETQGLGENEVGSWYRTNKYPLRDAHDRVIGILGIIRDITDRKGYEMRLEHQALHDPLTGLPNRRYVLKEIADAMVEYRTKKTRLAVLFCDLDFFKSVNDTHGHDFGDKCLRELTRRMSAELPSRDFVARFGGNEFVVLANASLLEASIRAEVLLNAVSRQLVIDDVIVKIQASIGIAFLHAGHNSPSELIRDADAAMYQAKEHGRNRVEIFDALLQDLSTKRAQLDVALRFALERNELALAYQPKVSLLDGSVKGFELLLRWNSPEYGLVPPNEFIPIAETSGLIVPIGLWALEQGCKQLSAWNRRYATDGLTLAVNVSMRQLLQSSFLSEVTAILKRTGVPPASIELELTETSAMANPVQTIETLSMLKKLGLRLALDDFGTGYSSLAYLQKLPLDVLKIDKAFIHGLASNNSDAEIVRLILALAQTLQLETVAEGVESAEQIALLNQMGCHLGQGYAYSPSISAQEAERLLQPAAPMTLAS